MDMSIFSQLRWNFVYQRPQHLIGRMAKEYRTFYFEEPEDIENYNSNENTPINYHHYVSEEGVNVIVPLLKAGDIGNVPLLEKIVKQVHQDFSIEQDIFWYYTPMAMEYTSFFHPKITIYDCMDQLAAFKNAPQNLISLEKELFKKADLIFTGGKSLYKAKKNIMILFIVSRAVSTKVILKERRQISQIPKIKKLSITLEQDSMA